MFYCNKTCSIVHKTCSMAITHVLSMVIEHVLSIDMFYGHRTCVIHRNVLVIAGVRGAQPAAIAGGLKAARPQGLGAARPQYCKGLWGAARPPIPN